MGTTKSSSKRDMEDGRDIFIHLKLYVVIFITLVSFTTAQRPFKVVVGKHGEVIVLQCKAPDGGPAESHYEWVRKPSSFNDETGRTNDDLKDAKWTNICNEEGMKCWLEDKAFRLKFEADASDLNMLYGCRKASDADPHFTAYLSRTIGLKRLSDDGQTENSFYLGAKQICFYCNATGRRPDHVIHWTKDKENITDDLINGSGIFTSFKNTEPDVYCGKSDIQLKGAYQCLMNLRNMSLFQDEFHYPVIFNFRVRSGHGLLLPAMILLGQICIIIIFNWCSWNQEMPDTETDEEIIKSWHWDVKQGVRTKFYHKGKSFDIEIMERPGKDKKEEKKIPEELGNESREVEEASAARPSSVQSKGDKPKPKKKKKPNEV